jgi:hypothetical protein
MDQGTNVQTQPGGRGSPHVGTRATDDDAVAARAVVRRLPQAPGGDDPRRVRGAFRATLPSIFLGKP